MPRITILPKTRVLLTMASEHGVLANPPVYTMDGNLSVWIDDEVEAALFMEGADLGDPESIHQVIKRLYEKGR